MKTPISYYGGKQNMLKHILPKIPQHIIYVEPFFGGGAVFWEKRPSEVEIINDFNANVVVFYQQLKINSTRIKELMESTPFCRDTYKQSLSILNNPYLFYDDIRAWAFWVATSQGFSNKIGSWRCAQNTNKEVNTFLSKRSIDIALYAERLKNVQIENKDAIELIKRHDSEDAFFYLDPPYVDSNQGHYGGYTQQHFDELLIALSTLKGKFLLSSYPNDKLNEFVEANKWQSIGINMHLSASTAKDRRKTEMLTFNYKIEHEA